MNIQTSMKTAFLFSVVFTLSIPLYAQAVHGVLRVVKGDVKIHQNRDGLDVVAQLGMKVFPKDIVSSGKDSRAKIFMIDNNEINVSPETKVQIQSYEFKPAENKKNVLLNVIYGKIRAKVNQKYDGENTFQVRTPSAVAGVRGTDFFTSYDSATKVTQVVTFEGTVAFGNINASGVISNPVMVHVGQTTKMLMGGVPTPPVEMPKTEFSSLERQTDAETHKDNKQPDGARPPTDENKKEKKDDEANPPKDGTKTPDSPAARTPSSEGSMLISGDLPGANSPGSMPDIPKLPGGPMMPPTNMMPPRNDFIQDVITSKTRRINLNITN